MGTVPQIATIEDVAFVALVECWPMALDVPTHTKLLVEMFARFECCLGLVVTSSAQFKLHVLRHTHVDHTQTPL